MRYALAGMGKGDHALTLSFTAGQAGSSKFEVIAGKKAHLASGTFAMAANGGESWTLTQPAWARRAPVLASATQTRGAAATQQSKSQVVAPEGSVAH